MGDQALLYTADTFPWPSVDDGREGSLSGLALAMDYPGLSLEERCVAMLVGDGALTGSAQSITRLADRLGIDVTWLVTILLSLNDKGFLVQVARWWS